jgi:peptide methionine sulfoxide reductase MsrA
MLYRFLPLTIHIFCAYGFSAVHHGARLKLTLNVELAADQSINEGSTRRTFLNGILGASIASTFAPQFAAAAAAATGEEELIDVYFGCGCFWHVQHEFVEAERKILGRSDEQLTARAGYAGGKAGAGVDGKVCYHNAANIADYGALGHAEIVSLRIPPSKFEDFAVEYFKLFEDGLRPDQFGDRGTEYRNLVGIPGGAKSPYAQTLINAIKSTGDQVDLAVGKGDDKDLAKIVYVMDTATFPSFMGEQYHQFHDGFNFGENYPNSYNSLASAFAKTGEKFSSCPNGMLGVGVGGL